MKIRRGDDPRLAACGFENERTLEVATGPSDGGDLVAVSHAFGAAAESGTLMLVSGPDNPTTLNFLPDTHVVVIDAKDVAGDYETLWQRVRDRYGAGSMPRTVNLITGPSRSADIEQTLILGAHGPRRLHVVVVGHLV
jgi:L-lactate dehydrogenase complex protein LldG